MFHRLQTLILLMMTSLTPTIMYIIQSQFIFIKINVVYLITVILYERQFSTAVTMEHVGYPQINLLLV